MYHVKCGECSLGTVKNKKKTTSSFMSTRTDLKYGTTMSDMQRAEEEL